MKLTHPPERRARARACNGPSAHLIALLGLVACSAKAPPVASGGPSASAAPSPSVAPVAIADAGAKAASPAEEGPLAWGTRPDTTGPLYPVVDGMCIHMEVWPFDDGGAYLTYGNVGGGYNRGTLQPTGVRMIDDGLDQSEPYSPFNPVMMEGRWPGPLVAYSNLPSRVGMGDYAVEQHDASGWKTIAEAHEENDVFGNSKTKQPLKARALVARPVVFQGHVVVARLEDPPVSDTAFASQWTIKFSAVPPLEGIGALNGTADLEEMQIEASDDAIYTSYMAPNQKPVFREWRSGKVRDIAFQGSLPHIRATKPALIVQNEKLWELTNGKLEEIVLPAKASPTTIEAAPNGDLWMATAGRDAVWVARAGADGRHTKIDVLAIPSPAQPRVPDQKIWSAVAGGDLAGAAFDDVYAIGHVGTLFHREGDAWKEIVLPKAPWAKNKYRAETIAMKAKGDLFVNASYGEKGAGWKTAERYRAILRTKRPHEVLRCNEPHFGDGAGSGHGFMSFPPLADASCATPFVVILRTWYAAVAGDSSKPAATLFDAKSDFGSVRASIKAVPALGDEADLIDLRSGHQGYLGTPVPSLEAGEALIKELAKRVTVMPELRPELVCGTPQTIVSRRKVVVATGAWAAH